MPKKLLLLEFNELCPALLHRWMAMGRLPHFKRFHDQSQVYATYADAEPPALEPWIQWYSIHTGLSFAQHQVFRLTEGCRAEHHDIWTVLQRAGLRTANCASMNAKRSVAADCFFLPDPWSHQQTFPDELEHFHRFVSMQVRDHTTPQSELRSRDALKFLMFLARHGLRGATVIKIIAQLCQEILSRRELRWKRVTILDLLQFDIFAHYFGKLQPHFTTFFLNSTAHLQHAYWRHMEPEVFASKPNAMALASYQNAILHGYECMDALLQSFLQMEVEEDVTLALATGLSQKPFLKYEETGGQRFYRPRDINRMLDLLGIQAESVDSVMAHEYVLRFRYAEELARAQEILCGVSCEGNRVFEVESDGALQLYLGSRLQAAVSKDALVCLGCGEAQRPFYDMFYLINERKSGCHDPQGLFWLKVGPPTVHSEPISILDIFPSVLEFLGVDYPPSETHPYQGQSRVPEWKNV